MKVLQVVGVRNSGKTYFIERLIKHLIDKGYRVATIKHSTSENIFVECENKDSSRHLKAGSQATFLVCRGKILSFKRIEKEIPLPELIKFIKETEDFDFLIIEGYKNEKYPKIEIYRKNVSENLITPAGELLAVVTDGDISFENIKVFSIREIEEITRYLEENLKEEKVGVELKVDGKKIPLNEFVKSIFRNVLKGIVSSLKGVEKIKKISLFIDE